MTRKTSSGGMMLKRGLFLAGILAGILISQTKADVRMNPIFSDHMVLQSNHVVPVWGGAKAGEEVKVSILNQSKTVVAGKDGKWMVKLDPMQADKPTTMTIQGGNSITIRDVLIGEVWLCSGQSNMALPVAKAQDYEHEKAVANWPQIRMYENKWVVCSPETVGGFSAAAYYFGREIHQKTSLPVGLINRSSGGTPIELWTRWEAQKDVADLKPIWDATDKTKTDSKDAAAQAEIVRKQAVEVEGKKAVASAKVVPGYLYESRIAPLIPLAIRGVIWYQGEANSYTVHADLYGKQLAIMITDWRRRWGTDFPFIAVQLPELGKSQSTPVEESGRAYVREGVLQSLQLPNVGMAVTLGTGEGANNHPRNKQEVGRRLALWALAKVYEQKGVVPMGPVPAGHKIVGDSIVVTFDYAEGGLVAKNGELKGFAIAGKDQKWVWAKAQIKGNTVIVSHPDIKEPAAVRYAWAGNPDSANLSNHAGLPASPFRTDDWK